jgi:hypothetical protein
MSKQSPQGAVYAEESHEELSLARYTALLRGAVRLLAVRLQF